MSSKKQIRTIRQLEGRLADLETVVVSLCNFIGRQLEAAKASAEPTETPETPAPTTSGTDLLDPVDVDL